MGRSPSGLTADDLAFLAERHAGTLTTLRAPTRPHVVAIAFTYDSGRGVVSIISSDDTQKVRNVERHGHATVCQVDGPRWLALEGPARVLREADAVRRAVEAFERRYRPARDNSRRVAIEIAVEGVLGRA